jgi:hypothetical protein
MTPRIDPSAIIADAARVDLGRVFGKSVVRRFRTTAEHRLIPIGGRGRIMRVLVITLCRKWGKI